MCALIVVACGDKVMKTTLHPYNRLRINAEGTHSKEIAWKHDGRKHEVAWSLVKTNSPAFKETLEWAGMG